MKAIYDLMLEHLDEEMFVLQEEFSLPEEKPEETAKFAPGAMDGILFYHTAGGGDLTSEAFALLKRALCEAAAGDFEKALDTVTKFAGESHALSFADGLHQYIRENEGRLSARSVFRLAQMLMIRGERKEVVKIGMILLELFDIREDEKIRSLVRLMGLSDEFSLYAGFLMRQWEDGDEALFAMAGKVRGWGRIHAIRMLESVNEDMISWLILHGTDNDVMPAYSALDVYEKINFPEKIADANLALESYRGLASILNALLDEGPVSGISAIDSAEEVIAAFFEATKTRNDLEAGDLEVLKNLRDYLGNGEWEDAEKRQRVRRLKEDIEAFMARG